MATANGTVTPLLDTVEEPSEDKKLLNKATSADERKLFVNSLSWETTEDQFKEYFSKFGTVLEATIKVNEMGQSKGFGFVLFEEASSVEKVEAVTNHSLGGRKINAKKAQAKERCKKIFVGGVNPSLPEEEIRTHFEKFGEIDVLELPLNKSKDPPIRKGFIFITFKDADACDAATAKGLHKQELGDRKVDVKKAVPQEQHQGGGGGGRGAPRGRGRGGPRGGGMGGYGAYAAYDPYGYGAYDPYGYAAYDPYGYYGYGFPPVPMAGGGKMRGGPRGRGRGGGRGRGAKPY